MLDVMRTPPPVTTQVTWIACRTRMPDHVMTVLVYMPDLADDEPVWLGFWDDEADRWMSVDAMPLPMVTWWADIPEGPTEPGTGQG